MLSQKRQDERFAASATNALSALLDAHACSICHDLLSAPVALPCDHVFCSECVRRHLSTKSLCPHPTCRKPTTYSELTPLRGYDVALEPLRRTGQKVELAKLSEQKRLVFLSRKACSRAQLLERLRTHDIPTHGGTDTIANRYNEFVVRWNANLDAGVPKSKKSIVAAVMAAERGISKESRRPRSASAFFLKASPPKNEEDADVPAEGDDFATLVKKTRAREERKRRLAALAHGSEKRVCLTNAGQSLNEGAGVQSKVVAKEVDNDNDNVSGLYLSGPLSQPELTQGQHEPLSKIAALHQNANIPHNHIVSSQRLSINRNVCCLSIRKDEAGSSDGSNVPLPAFEVVQPAGHSVAYVPTPGAVLSQTTPEKQTAFVAEGREVPDAVFEGPSSVQIAVNPPPDSDTRNKASALSRNPPRNPSTKRMTPPSRPSSGGLRRPRPSVSSAVPLPYEKNLNIIPLVLGSEQDRNDADQNSRLVSQSGPSFEGTDVRYLQSGEVQPTKAQLERAERNRRAALEKRVRYYERQRELSHMRQPDL